MLDISQPVALMLAGILHFLEDKDEPGLVIDTLLEAPPAGSYLTVSHLNPEHAENAIVYLITHPGHSAA